MQSLNQTIEAPLKYLSVVGLRLANTFCPGLVEHIHMYN